jgi:hypothetical protein
MDMVLRSPRISYLGSHFRHGCSPLVVDPTMVDLMDNRSPKYTRWDQSMTGPFYNIVKMFKCMYY